LTTQQATYRAAIAAHWNGAIDGAHDLGHLDRVWANAQAIARELGAGDLEVLLPAAYFHDAVNLPKNHPDRARASVASASWAREYLAAQGYLADKLDAVAHAIAAHSFSANITPETLEAEILQDADRLEALGAIGIARMFHVGGAMGGWMFDADDPLAQNRPLDDKRFSLDHLEVKLFPIAGTMRTGPGREMALARVEWMRSFRSRLLREM
jgi:uncharacterized protein